MTVNECKDMFPSPYTPNQWYTMEHKGQKFQAMRNQQGFVHVRKVITQRMEGLETVFTAWDHYRSNKKGQWIFDNNYLVRDDDGHETLAAN